MVALAHFKHINILISMKMCLYPSLTKGIFWPNLKKCSIYQVKYSSSRKDILDSSRIYFKEFGNIPLNFKIFKIFFVVDQNIFWIKLG
jgi:hypothetical protein